MKKENSQKDSSLIDSSKQNPVVEVRDTFKAPPGFIPRDEFLKLLPKDTIGIYHFNFAENNVMTDEFGRVLRYGEFKAGKELVLGMIRIKELEQLKLYKRIYIQAKIPHLAFDDTIRIKTWMGTGEVFYFILNGKSHLIMDEDTTNYSFMYPYKFSENEYPYLIENIRYFGFMQNYYIIIDGGYAHCNGSGCRITESRILEISPKGKIREFKQFEHFGGKFSYVGDFNKDGFADLIDESHPGFYGGACNAKDSSDQSTKFEFNCYTLCDSLMLLKNVKEQSYGFWGCEFEEEGYMKLEGRLWFDDKKK